MSEKQQVQLLLNDNQHNHGQVIAQMILGAKQLECVVAFAKISGLKFLLKNLEKSLGKGLKARFSIGLDFYQTEPKLLRQLLKLSGKHQLELYVSDSSATFHPKIYALSLGKGCVVLIGSANLTSGGLQGNYEASAQIDDPNGTLMQSINSHIDKLIAQKVLLLATKKRIDDYEHLYIINKAQQLLANRRTERAKKQLDMQVGIHMETLHDILLEMKKDTSEDGFESNKNIRRRNRKNAAKKIGEIATMGNLDADNFVEHYVQLIQLFHSGGLHRGKNIIAENANKFRLALAEIVQSGKLTPGDAYQLLLKHFQHIPRAGVNVLTEILHALNNKHYAVMNQNAVSGMRIANVYDIPLNPTKNNVDAELYAHFCQQADEVRKALELADFTELDALFNYAYWRHEDEEDEEDE